MSFPCTMCGLCCKQIGALRAGKPNLAGWVQDMITAFPYDHDESGACSQLQPDNSCGVYENRPLLCNLKAIYKKNKALAPTILHWYRINAINCNRLMLAELSQTRKPQPIIDINKSFPTLRHEKMDAQIPEDFQPPAIKEKRKG